MVKVVMYNAKLSTCAYILNMENANSQRSKWRERANLFKIHNTCISELSKHDIYNLLLRPNKKISVFRVTGLTILGRVGTHILF